jgi:hypothetical protein
MVFRVAIIAVLGACGTSAGKEEVECGASWATDPPTEGTCDAACAEMTTTTGPACTTNIYASTGKIVCDATFEYDGERGCCYDKGMVGRVTGAGEPERDRRVFFLTCD